VAPFFNDTFTGTTGTELPSHTPDTGTSWSALWQSAVTEPDIALNASNQAAVDGDVNDGVVYTANATYPSADYDAAFTIVTWVVISGAPLYLFVRIQDIENLYAVRLFQPAEGAISQLYKKVSGTWTALGSLFTAPANGSVCKLEIVGTALKFYDDGVEVASATVSDISATGKAGLGAGGGAELITSGDDCRAHILDNFSVTDLGGGGGDPEGSLLEGKLIRGGLLLGGVLTR
jgi:hypothetical protein